VAQPTGADVLDANGGNMNDALRWKIVSAVVFMSCLGLMPALGNAQTAAIEIHVLQSMSLTDKQFLTGDKGGNPVLIAAELRLPRAGAERLPVVVLAHGSNGVTPNVDRWAQELNAMGVAAFIVDSFTGRGILGTRNDQGQIGFFVHVYDAYRALDLLAKHPRIDPARVGVMGFSRGARAGLYGSMKRFQRAYGPADAQFAAYIAFFAPCFTAFIDVEDISDRPIRLFHGTADDFLPVAPCRAYVARLQKAGKDVRLTEYAGANHIFDDPMLKTATSLPQAQSPRHCTLEENPVGQIINSQTRQPYTFRDPSMERGATIGYSAEAHGKAIKAVKEFLTATFNLK
jgi:dienelactone hydrolase